MKNEIDMSNITGASDKNSMSIQNNYRFDALIRAIDFFSQKFSIETLVDFAGDFINEILTLNSSAVFVYDSKEDCFVISKIRLYKNELRKIPNSKKLQDIARLYGSIITKNFSPFFSENFVNAYKPSLLIPLIHNDGLLGFIVTDGKAVGEFDEDDYAMAKALMRLFNNAFERNYFISELEKSKKKIDKLSFELYTANKTFSILFDEIDPNKLLSTGIDIFSEVSGSRDTSIAICDEAGAVPIKAFKSLVNGNISYSDVVLHLQDNPVFGKENFYEVNSDREKLEKIFKNAERFSELEAEYVIIISDNGMQGFVTLGKQKAASYSKETLDVVCQLAVELVSHYKSLTCHAD